MKMRIRIPEQALASNRSIYAAVHVSGDDARLHIVKPEYLCQL